MISEMRDPSKDFWRPYGFETNVLGRSVLPESKLKLAVGLQFLSGNPQRLRAFPNCNSATSVAANTAVNTTHCHFLTGSCVLFESYRKSN